MAFFTQHEVFQVWGDAVTCQMSTVTTSDTDVLGLEESRPATCLAHSEISVMSGLLVLLLLCGAKEGAQVKHVSCVQQSRYPHP